MQVAPIDAMTDAQKKANRRTGLILASVVLMFFVGFVARMAILGA